MNIELKRKEIRNKLRKADKQLYFKKTRMSLTSQYRSSETPKIHFHQNGQQQILDSILSYRYEGKLLDFASINDYIVGFEGQLRQDFKFEVGRTVLEHYRGNGHAIASLSHILTKCDSNDWLMKVQDLRQKTYLLIKQNIEEDEKSLRNARAIAFLFFGLINSVQNKQIFDFLPSTYNLFSSKQLIDQTFLLMLESSTHCRQLLPSQEIISRILSQQLDYSKVDPLTLLILCELIQNYICYELSQDLFLHLSFWIQRRLKQRQFSIALKKNIIKIITICLSYQHITSYINKQERISKLFQQIFTYARFGNPAAKEASISCITRLVIVSTPQKIHQMVQYYQLLEILIFSLDINLEPEMLFEVLSALMHILKINRKYCKLARQFGLFNQATRLYSSQVMKIAEIANIICQLFHDN